jgi:hypothetical protein
MERVGPIAHPSGRQLENKEKREEIPSSFFMLRRFSD